MSGSSITLMVYTRCQPEDDVKFNKWYNEVHIPMIMRSSKVKGAVRYKTVGEDPGQPRYVALYKFANMPDFGAFAESPELAAAQEDMAKTWGDRAEVTSRLLCEQIIEW